MLEKLLGSLLPIKIGLLVALFAGAWLWHHQTIKTAVAVALEAQKAKYTEQLAEDTQKAKEAADEVRKFNEQSRIHLLANAKSDAERLRNRAVAGLPPVAECPGTTGDQRAGDQPRESDTGEAGRRIKALSDAIADLSAELKICGQSVGNVEKITK